MTDEKITGSNMPKRETLAPLEMEAFSWDEWENWVKATKFKNTLPLSTVGKPL